MHPELFTSIIHLHFTPQGKFWIATRLGIFLMLAPDKPLLHVQAEPKNPLSLPVDTIVELYQDRQGRMWVGTESGVCVEANIFGEFRCFYVDGKRNSGSSMNYIYSIFQDDRDKIWVGTRTGLYQLNEQNGTFTEYGQQILSDNFGVHFIKGDAAGNLWLISHTGVIKFYPDSSEVEVFDKSDGLSGSRYYVNLVAQSSDGTIYLSSRDGIHYFNPSLVQERELNSPTVLTNFELIGQRNVRDEAILPSNNIQLAPDQNYIKFEFSTLDLNSARRIRYYYKLEGLDDEWLDNGNSNAVMYTNLSGGDYVFRVRPALKNNLYYENELAVKLTIGTPFWLTGWMFGVYAILGLLLVQAYIHFRHRINQAEIERQRLFVSQLESQVAEKTEAIREESRKLALANRVKSEFLANMSHEIRTPLTSVIGHAEAIIHGDVEESSIKQEVARIHNHSRHLLALLNDILDVTRIEQNKLELEPHEQDIQALLTDVRDMFTSQAEAKGLTFRMISQLPVKLVAHVDGLRLKQVLINLCSNALKFTQQGSVDVIVSLQDNRLLFNVVDTGIGMTEEHQKRIFETFSQGDSSINRRFGGSGLGLALSRQLVNLMDGELRVTSAPNKGSIFTFSIPLTLVEHASELPSISPSQALPELSGCVLLAEDHPDNRRLIERLLKRLGLRVLAAQNGFEAIELYVNHQPDVVLLDIQMPQKDGLQTFRELRELGCIKPIVAITANAMVSDIKHYRAIGFNGYLRKPIEREQMVALMLELFSSGLDQAQMVRQLNEVDTSDLQQTFIARLETEKNQLSALLDQQNWQVIAQLAHRLGSAQFFGFRLISEKAIEVEMAVKDGHLDTLPELVRQLLDTLTSAKNSVRE
ncbi:ATP-binding protein [Pseudobowmanella zhangzhouensis]|uniref:hybrid sensor histidine kinase/response regulator n=1 Tax=Pseudobowmanella zhangzhouensis TaxID=1537679 RepID=UPI003623098A